MLSITAHDLSPLRKPKFFARGASSNLVVGQLTGWLVSQKNHTGQLSRTSFFDGCASSYFSRQLEKWRRSRLTIKKTNALELNPIKSVQSVVQKFS